MREKLDIEVDITEPLKKETNKGCLVVAAILFGAFCFFGTVLLFFAIVLRYVVSGKLTHVGDSLEKRRPRCQGRAAGPFSRQRVGGHEQTSVHLERLRTASRFSGGMVRQDLGLPGWSNEVRIAHH